MSIVENIKPLYTLKGSKIWYSKFGVGKQMGSKIYIHKRYMGFIVPMEVWNKALSIVKEYEPDFNFNCICYNTKTPNIIRFDEAPDFNKAREPHVGTMITVNTDLEGEKSYRISHSNQIWHGKWLWVAQEYKGFDVQESYKWSKLWLSYLHETASGSQEKWEKQLLKYGLPY